jgi:hypothetical protein
VPVELAAAAVAVPLPPELVEAAVELLEDDDAVLEEDAEYVYPEIYAVTLK